MNDRTWNIVELVERFEDGAMLSTRQIADRYRVHVRTAERWVHEIDAHRGLERVDYGATRRVMWRKGQAS